MSNKHHRFSAALAIALVWCLPASAAPAEGQDEAALRSFFEGRRVILKIDMPASADGVDLRIDNARPIDYQRYGNSLKNFGISIRSGESAIITLIRVKKDLIEFQLGGGGFGTFGDDTSTSVDMPAVEKTNRERDLERLVKSETDAARKRTLQRELDDLRSARERENRRIAVARTQAEEQKKTRIAEQRLKGGSRFNLRYPDSVPSGVKPDHVMSALADFVEFPPASVPSAPPAAAADAVLRKGLLRADAERLLGKAVESSDRREGTLTVTTLVFIRGEQRITAEFVEDVLVRYTISSK